MELNISAEKAVTPPWDAELLFRDVTNRMMDMSARVAGACLASIMDDLRAPDGSLAHRSVLFIGAGSGIELAVACQAGFGTVHGIDKDKDDVRYGLTVFEDPERIRAAWLAEPWITETFTPGDLELAGNALVRHAEAVRTHKESGGAFDFTVSNAHNLIRAPRRRYDAVVLNFSLHTLGEPHEIPWILDGLANLLEPSGQLAFATLGKSVCDTEEQWHTARRQEGYADMAYMAFGLDLSMALGIPPDAFSASHHGAGWSLRVLKGTMDLHWRAARSQLIEFDGCTRQYLAGITGFNLTPYFGCDFEALRESVYEAVAALPDDHLNVPWREHVWIVSYGQEG